MASKPNSGQIKPGQILNPTGRPKVPEELRTLMRDTSNALKQQICEVVQYTVGEMNNISESTQADMPVFKAAIISLLKNSINDGDDRGIKIVMDRILGRAPEAEPPSDDYKSHDSTKDQVIDKLVSMLGDKA